VDAYLAEAPPERAQALARIRDLARATLTGYDEAVAYGMPTYLREGQPRFAFASQKAHLALYFMNPDAVAACADALASQDMGKGCLRFKKPAAIDYALVERLLIATRDAEHPTRAC
jgi:uncharacterized protein YdhG (YjbR/CyaY superfamily)